YAGDIGCYILGIYEPFNMQDYVISMGASIGIAHGISIVSDQETVAFVGDSTFFHASIPAIINCKFNNSRAPLVVILDNGVTAMTGHQPHPGSGFTGMGDKVEPIKIEEIIKAIGAEMRIANSFNQKQLIQSLQELRKINGLKVLISRGECRLLTTRKFREKGIEIPKFQINKEKCTKCDICIRDFACPAIVKTIKNEETIYYIDLDMCTGCSVCMQICPEGAIHSIKRGEKE
ncbi:MAG: thiamine pyrophosphate-dependent enzyme, partial [Nitrososphaerota archaeon]